LKKEGTGEPQYPDIALDAYARMSELSFEKLPDPGVEFKGCTRRDSVWKSWRENLPNRVQEEVVYRDAEVRLRIATEVVEDDSGLPINSNREGVRDKQRRDVRDSLSNT
jgi:hypothetical protein